MRQLARSRSRNQPLSPPSKWVTPNRGPSEGNRFGRATANNNKPSAAFTPVNLRSAQSPYSRVTGGEQHAQLGYFSGFKAPGRASATESGAALLLGLTLALTGCTGMDGSRSKQVKMTSFAPLVQDVIPAVVNVSAVQKPGKRRPMAISSAGSIRSRTRRPPRCRSPPSTNCCESFSRSKSAKAAPTSAAWLWDWALSSIPAATSLPTTMCSRIQIALP